MPVPNLQAKFDSAISDTSKAHPAARNRALCCFHARPAVMPDTRVYAQGRESAVTIDLFEVSMFRNVQLDEDGTFILLIMKGGVQKFFLVDDLICGSLYSAWLNPRPNDKGLVDLNEY